MTRNRLHNNFSWFGLCLTIFIAGCSQTKNDHGDVHLTEQLDAETNQVAPNASDAIPVARPNIIVVLADDMRAKYTGYEGHPLIQTPNIDSLAQRGAVFSNAFATSATCQPSRAALLTGQYERKHGINISSNSALSNRAYSQTYPMLLKAADYFVGYIGKNHTAIGQNAEGQIGYRSGVMDSSFDYWYGSHGHLGFYPKEIRRHAIFKNAKADTQVEILEEGIEHFFTADEAFGAGHDFLAQRPDDKPFALLINLNVPHNGGTGSMEMRDTDPELYRTTYRDQTDAIQLPSTYVAATDIVEPKIPSYVYSGEYIPSYNYVKTPQSMRERDIRVIQTISGIDKLLGKLLKKLESQGLSDNTIIVFSADHGILHGEFGLGGKSLVYDPAVRVPLIIYDPRINTHLKSDELVALIDIAPTLLDLAGATIPQQMQGVSLKPLLQGEDTQWRQELFLENMMTAQNYPRIEAVRTHQWKYIRYFDRNKDQDYADMLEASINGEQPIYEELFDIGNDPEEIHNLILEENNSAIANSLRQSVATMVAEYRGTVALDTIKSDTRLAH